MNKTVAVHDGKFHADDVLAVSLIKYFVSPYIKVIRTRNKRILAQCDYVIDVGNRYEITDTQVWIDHHQGFKRYDNGVIYATCGLLADYLLKDNTKLLEELRSKFLWPVEAVDNGQKTEEFALRENLLSFVPLMNVTWKDDLYGTKQDECFMRAVEMADSILSAFIERFNSYEEAEEIVLAAIEEADDEIVILNQYVGGWSKLVCQYNQEHPENIIKAGVVKSTEDLYLAQAVPVANNGFETHFIFPWAGLSNSKLDKASGLQGGVFCHKAGFLCGFNNFDAAYNAVKIALSKG